MTSFTSFSVKVLLTGLGLSGGNRLETCDPQLYISLHCLCYDESRAISDQAYVSLYLLSSQKKWEIVLPWKKKNWGQFTQLRPLRGLHLKPDYRGN